MAKNSNGQTIGYTDEMRARDLQRQAAEEAGSSLLSWLNPFNWGLFTWAIVLIGGFVGFSALSNDKSSGGILSKLFDMLPEGAQSWLAGKASGIDGDAAIALRKIAQRHGQDGLSDKDFMTQGILYDAMIEQPKALLDIAKTLPKGGEIDDTTRMALTAVRQIVNDPKQLATLLSDAHKATTYALLESLSPIAFKAGALGKFIDVTAKRDGTIDPAFVQLLNTLLTDGSLTDRIKPAEVSAFFRRTGNAEAFGTLLASVDDTKLDPKMRAAVDALRKNWGNLKDGLAEVAADKNSLQFLLDMGNKPQTNTGRLVGMLPDTIKTAIGKTMPEFVTKLPEKVGENADHLLALHNALEAAGVQLGGAAPATKRPAASPAVAH